MRFRYQARLAAGHIPRLLVTVAALAAWSAPVRAQTPSVHIDIGSATGRPGDVVDVTVSLAAVNAVVAATGNDITFDKRALSLDPVDCHVNPTINKSLVATLLHEDVRSKTLRIFVRADQNPDPIPNGPLYTCTFGIEPATLPDTFVLQNRNRIAFAPDGTELDHVTGVDGLMTVTLVVVATATPTPTATPSPTVTPTPTVPRCPHDLLLFPATAPAGSVVHVIGRCYLVQSGRHAELFFDTTQVGEASGDTLGNYAADITIPVDAAAGVHDVRAVARREIASGTLEVTGGPPPCGGDCSRDGQVTVNEVVKAVNIAVVPGAIAACRAADTNHDNRVAADELLAAVTHGLQGCPPGASQAVSARAWHP